MDNLDRRVPAVDWPAIEPGDDWPEATYLATGVDRYDADPNPFIMALPPITDDAGAGLAMTRIVRATAAQRNKPGHLRQHELGAIEDFFQPLDDHVDLFQRISTMIRSGYVRRNPTKAAYVREMNASVKELDRLEKGEKTGEAAKPRKAVGNSATLLGLSGVGKTSASYAVLGCYPQVIRHPRLTGPFRSMLQLVWLHVICPENASQKGLLIAVILAFDRQLGTDYHGLYVRRGTIYSLRTAVARLAFLHGLGLLVIDEVQHLNHAKAGGPEVMIDFFKILSEVMLVPLLLVGTEEAEERLSGNFQAARRHSGLPLFAPTPLYSLGESGQPEVNPAYRFFLEGLFEAQYLREPIVPNDDLLRAMHYMSAGIRAIDVKLFWLTQVRALSIGAERLTLELFRSVYQDCFKPLHEHLARMRQTPGKAPDGWSAALDTFMGDHSGAEASASAKGGESPAQPPPTPEKQKRPARAATGSGQDEDQVDDGTHEPAPSLVRIVAEGAAAEGGESRTGYESLRRAGIIRALGAEVLAQ